MRRFTDEEENTWHHRDAGPSRQNSNDGTMGHQQPPPPSFSARSNTGLDPHDRQREAAEQLLINGHIHNLSSAPSSSRSYASQRSTSATSHNLSQSQRSQDSSQGMDSPAGGKAILAGFQAAMGAPNGHEDEGRGGAGAPLGEAAVMGFAAGSDEMLMTLLAGQAAVDCENLPVGGWEQVEGWKKVSLQHSDKC